MKKIVLFLLLAILGLSIQAQTFSRYYSVRYVKQHLLYHKDKGVNVVDFDLEWPEYLDFSSEKILQNRLCQILFEDNDSSLGQGKLFFLSRFGSPVTEKFDTIPDDSKFCYADCVLRLLAYEKGKWASFYYMSSVKPEKNSFQKAYAKEGYLTYDIIHRKIYDADGLLNNSKVQAHANDVENNLLSDIFQASGNQLSSDIKYIGVSYQGCLLNSNLWLSATFLDEDNYSYPVNVELPFSQVKSFLAKDVRRLIDSAPVKRTAEIVDSPDYMDNDTAKIYTTVDSLPQYRGGRAKMLSFISNNFRVDNVSSHSNMARVVLSFVVEKDGSLSHFRSMQCVDPSLEREIIREMRLMPVWKPGTLRGQPVRTMLFQSFNVM